jgi:phosphoribosyl-AMP cyclohydrolase
MSINGLLSSLKFRDGLVPVIIVEADGQVLTLCYMNEEALEATLRSGQVHVFRRSRGRVMRKGDSSGHVQTVRDVRVDCEGNSLVMVVEQTVAACHAGYRTCYHRRYDPKADGLEICEERIFDPEGAYGP